MKLSVLVIAHNEEKYIGTCLASILKQTVTPDEIVVVAHNCTDQTEEIVRSFPAVRLVSCQGPAGAIYARIKGFEEVTGDIICCIDGDGFAPRHWLKNLRAPFKNPTVVAVGAPVLVRGNIAYWYAVPVSFYFKYVASFIAPKQRHYAFWGANFAIRKSTYDAAGGIKPFIALAPALGLTYYAEDFYLAVVASRFGTVTVAFNASVSVPAKNTSFKDENDRIKMQIAGAKTLLKYFYS